MALVPAEEGEQELYWVVEDEDGGQEGRRSSGVDRG